MKENIPGRGTTFLLGQLGNIAVKGVRDSMEEFDIHPRQFAALATIDSDPGISQQKLSEQLLVHRSAMVGLIDELEKRELVDRQRREDNRREHALYLTPKGEAALQKLRNISAGFEAEFLQKLTSSEAEQLRSLLSKLAQAQNITAQPY